MNRKLALVGLLVAAGCSSSSSPSSPSGDDAETDGATADGAAQPDGTTPQEAGNPETGGPETGGPETGGPETGSTDAAPDASDGGSPSDGQSDADSGVVEAGCPGTWLDVPTVAALALPDGGVVLLHAAGAGTQDYACVGTPIDAGADAGDAGDTYAWTLTGPDAVLSDCNGTTIGHHFASEAGASAPEWQTLDGTYVIGHKLVAYTPDGGAASVPWLLLQGTSHGGSGTLASITYVQRLDTDGGVAPATGCGAGTVGATTTVPYTADYYFFGP